MFLNVFASGKRSENASPSNAGGRVAASVFVITGLVGYFPLSIFCWQTDQSAASTEAVRAVLSSQEWMKVENENNATKRVRKLLEMAGTRLSAAGKLVTRNEYKEGARLIEHYTTIISHALGFIEELPREDRKKRRGAYREFDLRIRKQIPVLEGLGRDFPVGVKEIGKAIFTAKRLRIIALNGFSGAEIIKVPEERPEIQWE